MQKKLIAAAVGGALTAIGAPALAQNATVNVYGTFYGEYSRINNGRNVAGQNLQTYDHFQNPGSEIGFRGEEKLGGGLSAWFQCASSLDYRGGGNASSTNNQTGSYWCSRNSALGLKGGFGNLFYGNWQTPFTRINSAGNVGSNDTGIWGNAHIMTGTSSTFGTADPGQNINSVGQAVFRRRQNNMFTYETPNFGGFTAMGAITTRNHASAATPNRLKARLYSVGAQFSRGPVFVGAAYEVHDNFYNRGTVALPNGGDDKAWTVAAAYTLPINLKLGGSIVQTKSDAVLNAQTKVTSFHFGIDWMIAGPHGVRLGYSRAGDVKGPPGTLMAARPAAGANTKADIMQIRYVYALSKRTEVAAGYSRTNNRANANYETGGSTTAQQPGSDSSAFGISMRHTF